MTKPTSREIRAMAAVAGIPVDEETATRVAAAMGPVLESFGAVGGTLPMDLEPALFVLAQTKASSR